MSIASYAMSHKRVMHFILTLFLVGGIVAFQNLGKQEDAPFIIKEAIFTTQYPGASQHEVEELVTEVIEREIQSHWGVDFIKSESRAGLSIVRVSMYQDIPKETFNQIWDELRRKVLDVQPKLPPGASPIDVNDDFGDVFGVYYALTADEGFTYYELEQYAEFIKRELVTVQDVKKVTLFGLQPKVVNVEISQEKLANAGVHPNVLASTIQSQNKLVKSGKLQATDNEIRIDAKGTFQSMQEIEELVISGTGNNQFRLKDLATVTMDYLDPPMSKMRMNGLRAAGVGISTREGGNSVVMGELVAQRIQQLKKQLPVGIEIEGIYFQDKVAVEANNNFILNLIVSISIVVLIILLAMGVRAGILIGSSLLFSILGTLLLMLLVKVDLHRTSLAAIIVAMGMLVDNAIVVTDNAMMSVKKGVPRVKALIDGATVPQWGLLGATFIAIISFLPLYMAPSNTAEVIKPLFIVLAISLGLSWIFALIQTTVYGEMILKGPEGEESKDPFDTPFYIKLKNFIELSIRRRWMTLGVVLAVFVGALSLWGQVEQSFFPAIDKPLFKIDYFLPQGSTIEATERDVHVIEEYLLNDERVKNVSITIGSGPLRYYLATVSWSARPNLANFLVETNTPEEAESLMSEMRMHLGNNFPDALPIFYKFKVSPYPDAIIEPTFMGPDPEVLRGLANQAVAYMKDEELVESIRDSWGEQTLVWTPIYSQNKGQIAGVSREDMATTLTRLTDGQVVGEFREGDEVSPILIKDANRKDYDYGNLGSVPVFNKDGVPVSLDQVTEGYELKWENPVIMRYNRQRAIAAQCDPVWGVENPEVEANLMPLINGMELPEGYTMFWDGIYEDQVLSQEAIASQLPVAVVLMITILVFLFNSYRKPLIILLMIPLIMIGVILGFLVTGQSFGFFAILGLLGLIGMVIKNAIVLIDQIEIEVETNGLSPYDAVVRAAQSRAIPVSMAAGTTILGMIPLLPDPMFGGMAATIMGGLFVATMLTIIVLPVLYAIMYKLKKEVSSN